MKLLAPLVVIFCAAVLVRATEYVATAQAPLSPLEALTYDNAALRSQIADLLAQNAALKAAEGQCYARLGPLEAEKNRTALSADVGKMKVEFEKARPGFTFDPGSKTFAAKPAPKPAPPPPDPKPKG